MQNAVRFPSQSRKVYDPEKISLVDILRWFWESHDPTQGMGQGNDRGTQYRLSQKKPLLLKPPDNIQQHPPPKPFQKHQKPPQT